MAGTVTSNANSGPGTLRRVLNNASAGETIIFDLKQSNLIRLKTHLPIIDKNLTIDGSNLGGKEVIIDGNGSHPGFFIEKSGTAPLIVLIKNLTLNDCISKGGPGGSATYGGGGGMGAGGGVFVNNVATVTLKNITFTACGANGGTGGNGARQGAAGGGGGLGGEGSFAGILSRGGGGGGLYTNADDENGGGTEGGDGQTSFPDTPAESGGDFGGGGGTNINFAGSAAGVGGFAGGGGGGIAIKGGDGGTGGGGGASDILGGSGGKFYDNFGGGKGGLDIQGPEDPQVGGGGGAGVGGAVFVRGGTLTFDSDIENNQTLTAGAGGTGKSSGENGSADGMGIYLMNGATLKLEPSGTKRISAQISGQGAIIKEGAGTYIITSTNNYTGTTQINNGTLIVNGSIKSSTVTVGASGTLSGAATVGPLVVDGKVKPGNSIGTIQVNGNYTQNANSTYQVEIDPTEGSSKLAITGTAQINNPSTIEVTALSGEYDIDHQYTVLNANGGRTNQYSTFTITNPNELDAGALTISYTPNTVELTFLTHSDNITVTALSIGFVSNSILNQVNHSQSDLGFEQSILRYYQSFCPCKRKKIRPYLSANYLHGHYKTSNYTLASPFSLSGVVAGLDYWNQTDLIIGGFFNY
ncbi:MAG: Extracellular serine protease, partial [Candidatus Anoxychlamydiales bacterium]|nr:Extracellular serine protease [Candidatus Anoxychlamydiales bacterium]